MKDSGTRRRVEGKGKSGVAGVPERMEEKEVETLSLTIGMEKRRKRWKEQESSHPPVLHLNEGEARVERFT